MLPPAGAVQLLLGYVKHLGVPLSRLRATPMSGCGALPGRVGRIAANRDVVIDVIVVAIGDVHFAGIVAVVKVNGSAGGSYPTGGEPDGINDVFR